MFSNVFHLKSSPIIGWQWTLPVLWENWKNWTSAFSIRVHGSCHEDRLLNGSLSYDDCALKFAKVWPSHINFRAADGWIVIEYALNLLQSSALHFSLIFENKADHSIVLLNLFHFFLIPWSVQYRIGDRAKKNEWKISLKLRDISWLKFLWAAKLRNSLLLIHSTWNGFIHH